MEKKKSTKIQKKQSRAKRTKILLKQFEKKFEGDYLGMANFKEPVIMLIRRTKKVEWYDDANVGYFTFAHTDGTKREVKLDQEFLLTFDYGKRQFRGYIIHEDFPTPLPEDRE